MKISSVEGLHGGDIEKSSGDRVREMLMSNAIAR